VAGPDSLAVRRAAGAALRAVRRRGTPPHRLGAAARSELLRPGLAAEALLAAMQARFELSRESAERQLGPALADWRDALGCADPILVPANAQAAAAETALVPLPIPSWCTWLIDSGVLQLDGPPVIQGPRVVQQAWLAVIREVELSAVECFPVVFAARFGSGAASLHVHLALSPPFLSQDWRGSVCLRAAAHRLDRAHPAVRLWLGAPASPGATAPAGGRYGESVVPGHHSILFEPGAYVRAWTRGATAVPLPGMVTATIRRSVFDEQGFPEQFCHCDTFFYLRLCSRSRYLYIPKPLVVNRIQQQSVTRTLAQGRLTVREHQQFFHQFLKGEGRALQLDFLSRFRLRFKPSANAASQFAINGLLCGRHRKAWDAVSCVPIWQWPLLPVLVLRAWHRERGRMRRAGVPAHIFFH